MCQCTGLFPHEMESLLQALRRDLRSEKLKADLNPDDATYHHRNARSVVRLLDAINPRKPNRQLHKTPLLTA